MEIQCSKTIVCEKTDGVRFLMVEVLLGKDQLTLLVDREYTFRLVSHLHPQSCSEHLIDRSQKRDSLQIVNVFDGELVSDRPWRENNTAPIYLVFDCLVVN
jgi:hypothetical protein